MKLASMPAGAAAPSSIAELGCRIDNGNHLLLAGNRAALDYLGRIDALGTFEGPASAAIRFADFATGERWTLRPNAGRLPWWVLSRPRRVPGTRARDYLGALRLGRAPEDATVAEMLGPQGALSPPVGTARRRRAEHRGGSGFGAAVLADPGRNPRAMAAPRAGR